MTSSSGGRTHSAVDTEQTVITGGVAGAHVVTGIKENDELLWVLNVTDAADLTNEFSISDDDEITNTDTDTTGDTLLVGWQSAHARGGDLSRN